MTQIQTIAILTPVVVAAVMVAVAYWLEIRHQR